MCSHHMFFMIHDSQHVLLRVLRIEKCTEHSAFFPWFLGVLLAKGRVALGVGYLDSLKVVGKNATYSYQMEGLMVILHPMGSKGQNTT